MTQEDKELLLKDLCARLPHGIKVEIISYGQETLKPWFGELSCKDLDCFIHDIAYESIKPYLRPMLNMTEEEEIEYDATFATIKNADGHYDSTMTHKSFDFLNAHHFDYRGLIERGLAIEVTKENNPYENNN